MEFSKRKTSRWIPTISFHVDNQRASVASINTTQSQKQERNNLNRIISETMPLKLDWNTGSALSDEPADLSTTCPGWKQAPRPEGATGRRMSITILLRTGRGADAGYWFERTVFFNGARHITIKGIEYKGQCCRSVYIRINSTKILKCEMFRLSR